jgi:drug/metabolite transporter (DMT)-like permease
VCHMVACTLLSYAVSLMNVVPRQGIKSRKQFVKISLLSVVFCGSVVCGTVSLRYLPVSFNQASGATTPFFTAIFSAIITRKLETLNTYLALVPVVVGIILASGTEPLFHMLGFIVCVSATAARAFKSVLQGLLLASEAEKLNSMNLLMLMAPISVAILVPACVILEPNSIHKAILLAKENYGFVLLLLLNSLTAYFVNLTNFLVTKHTSALTLQVLGNAKGVVATGVSILLFRNPVSTAGMLGYGLTVVGVILYSESKKYSNKAAVKQKILDAEQNTGLSSVESRR